MNTKPQIKIALPKGRLLAETAALIRQVGWEVNDYCEGTRCYLLQSQRFPHLAFKVFHEKDIPVQVAIGNYDLGVCGLDWTEELLSKYPSSALVKVKDLCYGRTALYMAASRAEGTSLDGIKASRDVIAIASEYPNLAESFALTTRLRRFNVFPVWGAAEVYPPENADLVLIAGGTGQEMFNGDLVPVRKVLDSSACLIANKASWETRDLSDLLASIYAAVAPSPAATAAPGPVGRHENIGIVADRRAVRLALPDGHQQKPTVELLERAGIKIEDYPSKSGNRRPAIGLPGVTVKVIRPQDMPLQVANGNFDLALTGRDWLREHLYKFPSSPVTELLDLKFGWVKIVAVVHGDLPINDVSSLRQFIARRSAPLRVASEYVSIADKFARDNHLGMYRVIPTWGATEAFLPDDADLLIENTQTGRTLAQHGLKTIDTLFESTACLIGNKGALASTKGERIRSIVETLRRAVKES